MDTTKVTRVEVINHGGMPGQDAGRVFTFSPVTGAKVEISLQDDGRTLKVFIDREAS